MRTAQSTLRGPTRVRPMGLAPLAALVAGILMMILAAGPARAEGPQVRAVLFYSPSCAHCHQVMTQDLPPLQTRYGSQLAIVAVDVTGAQGSALYRAAMTRFEVAAERTGVPALFVADRLLVGSVEIPQQLPSLISLLLAKGGADWPDIPGLADALPSALSDPGTSTKPVTAPATTVSADPLESVGRDPVGNALAVAVLLGLLASLGWVGALLWRTGWKAPGRARSSLIPVLALAGLAVALYLVFVETSGASAVCGPVGDCNTVQQSEYARLFGLLPIGAFGAFGYLAILAAWFAARTGTGRGAEAGRLGLVALTLVGTLFSVYLTFLEPFVIGSTCAWCLTSALLMDALMLTVAPRAPRGVLRRSVQTPPPRRRAA